MTLPHKHSLLLTLSAFDAQPAFENSPPASLETRSHREEREEVREQISPWEWPALFAHASIVGGRGVGSSQDLPFSCPTPTMPWRKFERDSFPGISSNSRHLSSESPWLCGESPFDVWDASDQMNIIELASSFRELFRLQAHE